MTHERYDTAVMFARDFIDAFAEDIGRLPVAYTPPEVPYSDTSGLRPEVANVLLEAEHDAFIGQRIAQEPELNAYMEDLHEQGRATTARLFRRQAVAAYDQRKVDESKTAIRMHEHATARTAEAAAACAAKALEATLAEQLHRETKAREEAAAFAALYDDAHAENERLSEVRRVAARHAIQAKRLAAERSVSRKTIDAYRETPELRETINVVFEQYPADELAALYSEAPEKLLARVEALFEVDLPTQVLPCDILHQVDQLIRDAAPAVPAQPAPIRAIVTTQAGRQLTVNLEGRDARQAV